MRLGKSHVYANWACFRWIEYGGIRAVDGVKDAIVCNSSNVSVYGHWYLLSDRAYHDYLRRLKDMFFIIEYQW